MSLMLWLAAATSWAVELDGQGLLQDGQLSVSDDLEIRYRVGDRVLEGFEDHPDLFGYVEQVNRVNLLFSKKGLQAGLQFDEVMLLANRYYLDDVLHYERSIVPSDMLSPAPDQYLHLDKLFLKKSYGRKGSIQVGDHYAAFGRGLALNLIKNTDIDIDTSLRGAQAVVKNSDLQATFAIGLTNQQQVAQDNPNLDIRPNVNHLVVGTRLDAFNWGPGNFGLHNVIYQFAREDETDDALDALGQGVDASVLGATAQFNGLAGMDWFVEGDWFHYTSGELLGKEEAEDGYALYGSTAAYLGALTIFAEAKRYKNTEGVNAFASSEGYELASGPTLEYERVITEDSSAAVNSNDITGARVRLDWMNGVWTPHLEISVARDNELGGLHFNATPETIIHPVLGVDHFGAHVQLLVNGGYRVDLRDEHGQDQLAHLDLALDFPVGSRHGEFRADFKQFKWGENATQQHDFTELSASWGLQIHPAWSLTLYQDFTDNPLISSQGNLSDTLYGAAELQWKAASSTTVKAFYGAYKAGIRCAGGQCRNLPGFEGARMSVSSTF
jgi:hypothetical protein